MTPAVRQLKKQKIAFTLHQYQHDENALSYGEEAAQKLAVSAAQVFKTLVLSCSNDKNTLTVAIVPVTHQVNLKSFAKVLGVKKAKMAEAKQVEAATGYILGGVSPIGQKKRLKSIIDSSAQNFNTIYISGGKRGLEIEIKVTDLANVISAQLATII